MQIIRFQNLTFIPASHEDPKDPGVLKKVLVKAGDLPKGEIKMINWAKMPTHKDHAPHSHDNMIEIFVLIKGTAEVTLDNEKGTLSSGDAVIVPEKTVHIVKNPTSEDIEFLTIGLATSEYIKT